MCGSLLTVSKSTVIPKGIPISSVLAYRRPIEPLELSTLCEMSSVLNESASKAEKVDQKPTHCIRVCVGGILVKWGRRKTFREEAAISPGFLKDGVS